MYTHKRLPDSGSHTKRGSEHHHPPTTEKLSFRLSLSRLLLRNLDGGNFHRDEEAAEENYVEDIYELNTDPCLRIMPMSSAIFRAFAERDVWDFKNLIIHD